ncbi:MAG: PilZ domain-containing protein [Desulfomonilaceae bacterium]
MGNKRQINSRDILNDIRSWMASWELQVKYKLSAHSLQAILKKLVERNAISHSELYEISPFYRARIDRINGREHPRADLTVYVPIYDIGSGAIGVLRDISETGLRVAGIESNVGQATTFHLPIDIFIQSEPLLVITECKWVEIKGRHKKYPVAGFEIIDLPERDSQILRNFIKFLLLSESVEWETIG